MIEPLTHVQSPAVAMMDPNIDTDVIFPARFLLLIDRSAMRECFFRDRRLLADGSENPEFPMNRDGRRDAKIIVAGTGFGCGSSREQAVWAIVDYGVRVIIGTDFGDIFSGNAAKNGLLLIRVDADLRDQLAERAEAGGIFAVDLASSTLSIDGAEVGRFELGEKARELLINGWDEMDLILNTETDNIGAFEVRHRTVQPWLFQQG